MYDLILDYYSSRSNECTGLMLDLIRLKLCTLYAAGYVKPIVIHLIMTYFVPISILYQHNESEHCQK